MVKSSLNTRYPAEAPFILAGQMLWFVVMLKLLRMTIRQTRSCH